MKFKIKEYNDNLDVFVCYHENGRGPSYYLDLIVDDGSWCFKDLDLSSVPDQDHQQATVDHLKSYAGRVVDIDYKHSFIEIAHGVVLMEEPNE